MRRIILAAGLLGATLAACSGSSRIERASIAEEAQSAMVGLSEAEVLSCMGPPETRADGLWTYRATERKLRSTTVGGAVVRREVAFDCTAEIGFSEGRVTGLTYSGRTGGLLTEGEQCGRLVQRCLP